MQSLPHRQSRSQKALFPAASRKPARYAVKGCQAARCWFRESSSQCSQKAWIRCSGLVRAGKWQPAPEFRRQLGHLIPQVVEAWALRESKAFAQSVKILKITFLGNRPLPKGNRPNKTIEELQTNFSWSPCFKTPA